MIISCVVLCVLPDFLFYSLHLIIIPQCLTRRLYCVLNKNFFLSESHIREFSPPSNVVNPRSFVSNGGKETDLQSGVQGSFYLETFPIFDLLFHFI